MFRRTFTVSLVSMMSLVALPTAPCDAAPPPPGVYFPGIPVGATGTTGVGVSSDGSRIVGTATGYSSHGGARPFVWGFDSGRIDFPDAGRVFNIATGISGDGSTVIGYQSDSSGFGGAGRAFRQRVGGVYEDIGPSASWGPATTVGVNMDGTAVTGVRYLPPHPPSSTPGFGYIWREGDTMRSIGAVIPSDPESQVSAMSRDGSTIVGSTTSSNQLPFVWRADTGMRALSGGTAEYPYARVTATNSDGSILMGSIAAFSPVVTSVLVSWRGGVQSMIGRPGDASSVAAVAVNDDGNQVLLAATLTSGLNDYYMWSASSGFLRFQDYLALNGVSVPFGLRLGPIRGMSADGRTFVGSADFGTHYEAMVISVPSPTCPAVSLISSAFCRRRRFA